MGVEAVAGGDDAGYVLEAASGAIEGQARGHGFARIDPEIAIHMLAVRPARADRRDDRHPVREGERIREAGIRHYAPGAPRHGLRGADREGQLVELEVGKEPASGSGRDAPNAVGDVAPSIAAHQRHAGTRRRSEEHTSELQSLMRNSYAV